MGYGHTADEHESAKPQTQINVWRRLRDRDENDNIDKNIVFNVILPGFMRKKW